MKCYRLTTAHLSPVITDEWLEDTLRDCGLSGIERNGSIRVYVSDMPPETRRFLYDQGVVAEQEPIESTP